MKDLYDKKAEKDLEKAGELGKDIIGDKQLGETKKKVANVQDFQSILGYGNNGGKWINKNWFNKNWKWVNKNLKWYKGRKKEDKGLIDIYRGDKKASFFWFIFVASLTIFILFLLLSGGCIKIGGKDIQLLGTSANTKELGLSPYFVYVFFAGLTFFFARRYALARRMYTEAINRWAMAKMFEKVNAMKDKDSDYKRFLPKIVDSIAYSTIKNKNKEEDNSSILGEVKEIVKETIQATKVNKT